MELDKHHTFDAPIDAVWAMFLDKESHLAKFASMGHRDVEILSCDEDDSHLKIEIKRVVDLDVPSFARKVLKPSNTVVSTDTWQQRDDGTYGGTFEIDIKGAPVQAKGRTTLAPADGGGTDYTIEVDIKVKVPLIGGKIEGFAKGDIEKQIDQEFVAGDAWLAR
jgi:hypothetical protein